MQPVSPVAGVSTVKRCLLALGVLLGVLLMHGVAADHDTPMVAGASAMHGVHGVADRMVEVGNISSIPEVVSAPPSHSMATACVAVLGGGLLLPLIAALRVKKRDTAFLAPNTGRSVRQLAAEARWLTAPSLTRLCVSRT